MHIRMQCIASTSCDQSGNDDKQTCFSSSRLNEWTQIYNRSTTFLLTTDLLTSEESTLCPAQCQVQDHGHLSRKGSIMAVRIMAWVGPFYRSLDGLRISGFISSSCVLKHEGAQKYFLNIQFIHNPSIVSTSFISFFPAKF